MNAILKPAQRSLAQLKDRVRLAREQRGKKMHDLSKAQAELADAVADGDDFAERRLRERIAALTSEADRIKADEEAFTQAVHKAQARELQAAAVRDYDKVRTITASTTAAIESLETSIADFGLALVRTRAAIDSYNAAIVQAGLQPEAVAQTWFAVAKMALHLASDGAFGELRTLDTPMQLRDSGRASLKKFGFEFSELTLRQARTKFGINETGV